MAETEPIANPIMRPNWGAIWAGVFTFMAIWSVFGLLGMAIFASANSNPQHPVSLGMGIWAIILTIIAMYVAGRATGRWAAISNSRDGVMQGMVMFGLSVASILVISFWTGMGTAAGLHSHLSDMSAELSWIGFISLFLGWLAAMAGASAGAMHRISPALQQQVKHA